jgi:hypothetical protein
MNDIYLFKNKWINPHKTLQAYEDASNQVSRLSLQIVPMHIPLELSGFLSRSVLMIIHHLIMVVNIYRKGKNVILVREFLTVPLLIVCPLLLPIRNRLKFLLNHNLQTANHKKTEGIILIFLNKIGFRFVNYESGSVPPSLQGFTIDKTLPFPVQAGNGVPKKFNPIYVGFIGSIRPEKNIDPLLGAIESAYKKNPTFIPFLGCDNNLYLKNYKHKGFKTVDTTLYAEYQLALSTINIIVLNYDINCYEFRSSGVVADAISHRIIPIVPNYPIMAHQVQKPNKVGMTFKSLDELDMAINEAVEFTTQISTEDYAKYETSRNVDTIAILFQEWVDEIYG